MTAAAAHTAPPLHNRDTLVVGDLALIVAPPGNRKTIEIVVERDASLILKAPPTATISQAEQFVTSKREWIYRKLADKDALTGPPIAKQFVEGEGFAYLGHNYRLTLTTDSEGTGVRLGGWCQMGVGCVGRCGACVSVGVVWGVGRGAGPAVGGSGSAGPGSGVCWGQASAQRVGPLCSPSAARRAMLWAAASRLKSASTLGRPRTRALRPPCQRRLRCASLRSTLGRVAW